MIGVVIICEAISDLLRYHSKGNQLIICVTYSVCNIYVAPLTLVDPMDGDPSLTTPAPPPPRPRPTLI